LIQLFGTLKNNANAKFLESIDLSFKINLKKIKTADSSLRSVIELPHGNWKKD
jgi:ribosomal protein L1